MDHFPYRSTASTYFYPYSTYKALNNIFFNNIFNSPKVQLFQSPDFLDKKDRPKQVE